MTTRPSLLPLLPPGLGSMIRQGLEGEAASNPGGGAPLAPSASCISTGCPALDRFLRGGIPRGAVTEIVGSGPSGKLTLALGVLRAAALARERGEGARLPAYVDLSRSVFTHDAWARRGGLLVVRTARLGEGVRALDVLVASGCFAAVVLDVPGGLADRGLPEAVGLRLARLSGETGTAVALVGERPLLPGLAALRIELHPTRAGEILAEVRKNRRGAPGSVALPLWGRTRGLLRAGAGSRDEALRGEALRDEALREGVA